MRDLWDLVSGKTAREDRERHEARERSRAEREDYYSGYANPSLAEFVGATAICEVCYAVTPDMPKHLAWHAG